MCPNRQVADLAANDLIDGGVEIVSWLFSAIELVVTATVVQGKRQSGAPNRLLDMESRTVNRAEICDAQSTTPKQIEVDADRSLAAMDEQRGDCSIVCWEHWCFSRIGAGRHKW
ncbi:MAG: hypothetical protein N3G20_01570 [Verrucomicrobiae bacterium]|nr:hypothetical protein [Verrucomicrobiae bacterium]